MDNNHKKASEESTIFSAPPTHNDKPSKGNGKRVKAIVLASICLFVSAGILLSVLFLLPKGEEISAEKYETIIKCNEEDLKTIEYTSADGESFTFCKTATEGFNSKGYSWIIEGIEADKQDKNTANDMAECLCSLSGIRMEEAKEDIYGFASPRAYIHFSDGTKEYSVTLGNEFGEDSYLKIEGNKSGIFRIKGETAEKLIKEKLDFATHDAYGIATFSTDVSAYKSSGGSLERFDYLNIKKRDANLTFTINENEITREYSKFLLSGKYSENGDKLLSLFTDTLYIDGAFSYFDDTQSINAFGLDDPDFVVSIKVGSEIKWFKFKEYNSDYYAVLSDDRHLITRVKKENVSFLYLEEKDYLYKSLIPFGREDISIFNAETDGKNINFKTDDIENNAETFDDIINSIKTMNPEVSETGNGKELLAKIEFTLNDNTRENLSFYSTDTTKIIVKTDGFSGTVSSAVYNKLIKKLKAL